MPKRKKTEGRNSVDLATDFYSTPNANLVSFESIITKDKMSSYMDGNIPTPKKKGRNSEAAPKSKPTDYESKASSIPKVDRDLFKEVLNKAYLEVGSKLPTKQETENIRRYFSKNISEMETDTGTFEQKNIKTPGTTTAKGVYQLTDPTFNLIKTSARRGKKYLGGDIPKRIKDAKSITELSEKDQMTMALINMVGEGKLKGDKIGSTKRLQDIGSTGDSYTKSASKLYELYHHKSASGPDPRTKKRMQKYFGGPASWWEDK